MQIKDQIRALTKNTLDDLVHNNYEKLQQEKILTEETTIFLQEVFALQGTLTWPLDEASVDIDVYEMDDQSCFISEIRYLWFDDEESAVILFCKAYTNADQTEITAFMIDTVDA
ncbi:hypothetical protein JTI58_19425 [Lysinibacillus fusiformis]|uniref:DUF7668 domain-containing protein n=1 Tax=Lysinibacillus fusiformis TaxID=28031 RepID=UPI00196761A8|nr:hypothetical protein [Lysinibacillus fusiformis]QSB09159.1 hypothetical protein JTI58_19425 [Lysinibacillus fusiformis]